MKAFLKSLVVRVLIFESQILLRRHRPTIIAITGSVGKTTTKDAVYAAIKSQISARKSEKSYNSEIGVPLTILGLPNAWNNPFAWLRNIFDGLLTCIFTREYPKVLILETGIDRQGDMERLVSWLKPNMVVLTRLPEVPVHVEYFDGPEAVVAEKMKLVQAMSANGVLIFNRDDVIIESQLPNVLQKQVGYGRYLESTYRALNDRIFYHDDVPSGVKFEVLHQETTYPIRVTGTAGTHYVYSCLAGMAVAGELALSLEESARSLESLEVAPGRLRIISGLKGTVLVDDTYNSSPIAGDHAIQTLQEIQYAKRKIALLGDMLELGKYSSEEHRKLGSMAAKTVDVLLTVGVRARAIAEGALTAGMHESKIFQYDDVVRAGRELQSMLQPGDVVLVKASQGMWAEKAVEEVMAEPERAEELLVRQSRAWKRIK